LIRDESPAYGARLSPIDGDRELTVSVPPRLTVEY